MHAPSDYRNAVLHHLKMRLGREPILSERLNRDESWSIGLAKFMHSPSVGYATHATVGLGELRLNDVAGKPFPGAQEILALTIPTVLGIEKALAGLCFEALRTGRICCPGDVFPDLLAQAIPGVTVPHVLITAPYAWEDMLQPVLCGERTVYWVMAVPISDGELELFRHRGEKALSARLEERNAQVTDLWRPSTS